MSKSISTHTARKSNSIVRNLFAGIAAMAALTGTASGASAIEMYNCLKTGVGVKLTGQSTGRSYRFRIEPGKRVARDTGRSEKWRLNLNPIGPDKQFSGQAGNAIISIVRIAGNVEVTRGNKCPAPQPQPQPVIDPPRFDDGDDSEKRFWKPRKRGYRLDARVNEEANYDHPHVADRFCYARGYNKASYRVATARKTIAIGDGHIFRNARRSNTSFKYIMCRR